MEMMRYPPHITFAIYAAIDVATLTGAVDRIFRDVPRLSIRFDKLNYFDAPHATILWASPILPAGVAAIHDQIHAEVGADSCQPLYRPGAWVPHCSLALAVPHVNKQAALELVATPITPFDVVFDVADVASFMPVTVVHERSLCS